MKMIALTVLMLSTASFAQAAQISCFTKYYTANQNALSLKADIVADGSIVNVQVSVDGDKAGETAQADRDPKYAPRKYKGYDLYRVDTGKDYFGVQWLLLPANLTQLSGRFDGYLSDGLADGEGSNGYYRLLCSVR